MKRFFICAAAAIVALASCSKTEVVNTSAPEEIGFKAVTGVMTKGVQTTASFTQDMGVLAYNTTDLTEYFKNAQFEKATTTVDVTTEDPETGDESTVAVTTWNGTTAKYWPIDSELDFVVYSPYQATGDPATVVVTNTDESKKLAVTVADNAKASLALQTDYMYGAEYYAGHDKEEAFVPVNFKHALSLITVNFTGNANVKIVSAVLDNTAQDGTYTVQYFPVVDPAITWAPGNADNDLTLKPTAETALSDDAITTEYMVVPTAASSITITYNIGGMTGGNLTKEIDLTETWTAGTHYTYNVNIGANEIKFSTSVTDWGTSSTPVEIQ